MSFKNYLKKLVDKKRIGKLIKLGIDNVNTWSLNNYYVYHDHIFYLDIKTYVIKLLLNLGINIVPSKGYMRYRYVKNKVYNHNDAKKIMRYAISKYCDIKSGIAYFPNTKDHSHCDILQYYIIEAIHYTCQIGLNIDSLLCEIIHNNKLLNTYPQINMVNLDIGYRVLELTA